MAKKSELYSKLDDGASLSLPTSIRGKMQAVDSYGSFQGNISPTTDLSTASVSPVISAVSTPPGDFGWEESKHISGFKLYMALFSIISVFFLVLLDFSILSTVSMDNP